jgi:Glycosyltransferase family 87
MGRGIPLGTTATIEMGEGGRCGWPHQNPPRPRRQGETVTSSEMRSTIGVELRRLCNVVCLLAATAEIVQLIRTTVRFVPRGIDLAPVLGAARIVSNGHGGIYDNGFAYLPSSAVAFAPFAHHSSGVDTIMASVEAVTVALAIFLATRFFIDSPWWPTIGGLVTLLVFRSSATNQSIFLENLGMIVALAAGGAAILMRRGKWAWACAVLGASLLVKPLLPLLFLVPILAYRWRQVLGTILAVTAVTILCASIAPGGWHLFHLFNLLGGTPEASVVPPIDNLTLTSIGSQHHVPSWLIDGARFAVAATAIYACVIAYRRQNWRRDAVPLTYVILLASLLAGGFFEISYVFLLAPLPVLIVGFRSHRTITAILGLGIALLFLPEPQFGLPLRVLTAGWCVGAVLAFAALASWLMVGTGQPEVAEERHQKVLALSGRQ